MWSFSTEMSFTSSTSLCRNQCVAHCFAPGCCWLMLSHLCSIHKQRRCQYLWTLRSRSTCPSASKAGAHKSH